MYDVDNVRFSGEPEYEVFADMSAIVQQVTSATASAASKNEQAEATILLEKAKQTTIDIVRPIDSIPPRTAADITAILEVHVDTNREEREAIRTLADSEPRDGADTAALVAFFRTRARAAGEAGRPNQQIADLTEALRLIRSENLKDNRSEADFLYQLSHAEVMGGNFLDAVRHRRESIDRSPEENRRIARLAAFSWSQLQIGDLDGAKASQREYLALEPGMSRRGGIYAPLNRTILRIADGTIEAAEGNYVRSESLLREALRIIESDRGNDTEETFLYRLSTSRILSAGWAREELAKILVRQGRLVEAEIEIRTALRDYLEWFGKYSTYTAYALDDLANVILQQSRTADAERLALAAEEIYQKIGASEDNFLRALVRKVFGMSLVVQERWKEAAAAYDQIESDLSAQSLVFEFQFRGDVGWALALIRMGLAERGLANLENSYQRKRNLLGDDSYDLAETLGMMAVARAELGDDVGALADFRPAVQILMTNKVGGGAVRDLYRRVILEAYIDLLARTSSRSTDSYVDIAEEAFLAAEAARNSSVQRALAFSAARSVLSNERADPELAALARREMDARHRIAAIGKLMSDRFVSGADDPETVDDLRREIVTLNRTRTALLDDINQRFPDYAELVDPKPATVSEAQAVLAPGEALVATYTTKKHTYVWVVPKVGPVGFSWALLGKKALDRKVAVLRGSLDPKVEKLGDIPAFDVAAAYSLYSSLLKPLESSWENARTLIVVANGALSYLPFALLPTQPTPPSGEARTLFDPYRRVPWLVRSHAVTTVPTVASFRALRLNQRTIANRRPFVGFGDPVFNVDENPAQVAAVTEGGMRGVNRFTLRATPRTRQSVSARLGDLPSLPDTAEEILAIAKALGANVQEDVFLGEAATEARVKALSASGDLARYNVVAFATHGLLAGDLDGLTQPALALSAPKNERQDGLLTMEEILGLRLEAEWVVLSACNTAAGEGRGAEAVSGLGRAFFYAGTRALLVSNWPVESTSAKALTTNIFKRRAENPSLSRAEILQQTMLELIDEGGYVDEQGRMVFSYAHPIFWAPFSLVGDGGGTISTNGQ